MSDLVDTFIDWLFSKYGAGRWGNGPDLMKREAMQWRIEAGLVPPPPPCSAPPPPPPPPPPPNPLVSAESERLAALSEKTKAKATERRAVVDDFLSRCTKTQRDLFDELFRRLRYRPVKGLWPQTCGKWLESILAVAPEPWRLDLSRLRDWTFNPLSVLNVENGDFDGDRVRQNKVARATARKMIIDAWREQVGVSLPPAAPTPVVAKTDYNDSHPFVSLLHMLIEGQIANIGSLISNLRAYHAGGHISTMELAEAEAMVDSGRWLSDFDLTKIA